MIYSNAVIPLVAEPIHRGRNDRECHRGHFCCAKAGVSRRKSVMPLRLLPNHQVLSVLPILDNSATLVENRSFQIVPKQKGAMNTLISGMGVPCTGTLRASVLSDSWAFGASATNCLMRALVPLDEKSSENVPERVLPYRYIGNWCNLLKISGSFASMFFLFFSCKYTGFKFCLCSDPIKLDLIIRVVIYCPDIFMPRNAWAYTV